MTNVHGFIKTSLQRSLRSAHRAYRESVGATVREDLIYRALALIGATAASTRDGNFLTMSIQERDEMAPRFREAISAWLRAAYPARPVAPVIHITSRRVAKEVADERPSAEETDQDASEIGSPEASHGGLPEPKHIAFGTPECTALSMARPDWRSSEQHTLLVRQAAVRQLLHGIIPVFSDDIGDLRSRRGLRVINRLDFHVWDAVDRAFDAEIGAAICRGTIANGLPYGSVVTDLAEHLVFEVVAAAVEGDEERFNGIVPMVELLSCGLVLGPVATGRSSGTWAVFHLPKIGK